MNKNKLFYLILFAITFIPVSVQMMASSNRKPTTQDDPFYGASAPTMPDDNDDPYKGASAPPLEQDNDKYQGYPDLTVKYSQAEIDQRINSSALALSDQQKYIFYSLTADWQQALMACSDNELKQQLNNRLTQQTQNKKTVKQTQFDDRDTEEAQRNSIKTYNKEQLQQAMENSKRENYAPKKTWSAWLKAWWSR